MHERAAGKSANEFLDGRNEDLLLPEMQVSEFQEVR
jgi:hypothetical protein